MMQDNMTLLFSEFGTMVQNWIRTAIREEVSKALAEDHAAQKPTKQYTRREVCKLLNISMPTLWAKTKNGEIRATKIGRRVLYSEREVQRLLSE